MVSAFLHMHDTKVERMVFAVNFLDIQTLSPSLHHQEDHGVQSPEKQPFGWLLWSDIFWSLKILLHGIRLSFPSWNAAVLRNALSWITTCFFF